MRIDAGHVGLVVSGKAQKALWPEATRWLADRSTPTASAGPVASEGVDPPPLRTQFGVAVSWETHHAAGSRSPARERRQPVEVHGGAIAGLPRQPRRGTQSRCTEWDLRRSGRRLAEPAHPRCRDPADPRNLQEFWVSIATNEPCDHVINTSLMIVMSLRDPMSRPRWVRTTSLPGASRSSAVHGGGPVRRATAGLRADPEPLSGRLPPRPRWGPGQAVLPRSPDPRLNE